MTLLSPFIGSKQSRYAAISIMTAVVCVSLSILFGADAMPISQKFFFIILIFLLSIPSILLSLMQLTCLVTGSGNQSKRWWCSLLSWIMSAFIIFYSIIIVLVSVQSLVLNKETFKSGANNFIREYPETYPFNTPAAMNNIHTLDVAEDGMPVHNSFVPKTQYLINESLVLEGFEDEEKEEFEEEKIEEYENYEEGEEHLE
jgi:hypothetical protein